MTTTFTPKLVLRYQPDADYDVATCPICGTDIEYTIVTPPYVVAVQDGDEVCEQCTEDASPTADQGRAVAELAEALSGLHYAVLQPMSDDRRRGMLGLALDGVQQIARHFHLTIEEAS